ncbi:MAG: glycosyltransferase family 1 protein [Deltaproteobacteria bacterium]|nr:glycosyltransferase family 1 protein [Deltaproteobacteria bacterium]
MKEITPNSILILYHNDNPFVGLVNKFKMRHYLKSIAWADIALVYRPSNIDAAHKYEAKRVEIFPPHYLSYRHRPMLSNDRCDVIFIGHYAPDDRAEYLDYLIKNGIDVRVYGTGWGKAQKKFKGLNSMNIRSVWGEEYKSILCSAKIALVFLSNKNRDVYTRRCFEIPACETLMLAPRTPALEGLFADGKEAVYYDSREDLLRKIQYYLKHDEERLNIAKAGRNRCLKDGHNEIGRAGFLIEIIEDIITARLTLLSQR